MNKKYEIKEEKPSVVSEPQRCWGGTWTENKLDAFEKYVRSYLTIMKRYAPKFHWNLFYFDAFAGSGTREEDVNVQNSTENDLFDEEVETIIKESTYKGAAERTLNIDLDGFGFNYYYFVDKDERSLSKLEDKLKSTFPSKVGKMKFRPGDANERVLELVDFFSTHKNNAALVLLDPFGMQLDWTTVQALKSIEHIDLWILVPSGVIINRLLTKANGEIMCKERLSKTFGMSIDDLKSYFYQKITEPGLFGEITRIEKYGDSINRIAKLYLERLKKEFKYVISEPLILRNSTNCPIFHFVFASHNKTGVKIASEIVGKKNKTGI